MASVRPPARELHLTVSSSTITLASVLSALFMAYRAFRDADAGLARFYLPVIGPLAEQWVGDE